MLTIKELVQLIYADPIGVRQTQAFGKTPYSSVYRYFYHTGQDMASSKQPAYITCPVDGEIIRDDDWNLTTGYGRGVWVKFKNLQGQNMSLLFGHLRENYVSLGQRVMEGQTIGIQGTTGFSTGEHIHLELYYGTSNPYLLSDKQQFLDRFVDPLRLNEFYSFKILNNDEMINQQNIQKIKDLEACNKVLLDSLAQALILNDNRVHVLQTIPSDKVMQYASSAEKVGILNEVYNLVLGRDVDQEGLKFWQDKTVLELIRGMAVEPEFTRRLLNIIYRALLNRDIDDEGFAFWQYRDLQEVIDGIKASEEYSLGLVNQLVPATKLNKMAESKVQAENSSCQ